MDDAMAQRWRVDGKFFRSAAERVWCRAVTYGPFPEGYPKNHLAEFKRIAASGFNAIRLYQMPQSSLLDLAQEAGLKVFAGLVWSSSADFLRNPALATSASVRLVEGLREIKWHPALVGVYVGNEVPADLVRWMGPVRVLQVLEKLIYLGKCEAPHLLFAYASYPSTEYLEPDNADFTAMNVFLEDPAAFRAYLRRLHHIAGDRPLVISEFGLDTRRNGLEAQARLLRATMESAAEEETAGFTVYAWSDRWWNGMEVLDWDFGLTDREGEAKPALSACASFKIAPPATADMFVSVIVCTRNGHDRIDPCLRACLAMLGRGFEIIVVDDGSSDGTADHIAHRYPEVRLIRLAAGGLSAARNAGAEAARGEILAFTDDDCEPDIEWVSRLRKGFGDETFAALGGPNLPPAAQSWEGAVVCAAPGAPSHVMLNDIEAEHLPGCNIAVRKSVFMEIGGFDPIFHTAGDDVDFCWRLRDAGHRLGFVPGAFVWHTRRPSICAFLKQQMGYGKAERLLMKKHPHRFSKIGGAIWQGFVYDGGPVRVTTGSVIYHGQMGTAGYQSVVANIQRQRGIIGRYDTSLTQFALKAVNLLQPRLRAWVRNRSWRTTFPSFVRNQALVTEEFEITSKEGLDRLHFIDRLLAEGWKPCGENADWDLEKQGTLVMLATERGDGIATRTLVRVCGDRELIRF